MTLEELKQKLSEASLTGLDRSPGDPLADEALKRIELLEAVARNASQPTRDAYDQYDAWFISLKQQAIRALF